MSWPILAGRCLAGDNIQYMLIAYIDESGNTGDPLRGGTQTYTLGCVLIDVERWPQALDEYVSFRRRLRASFGIKVRSEVKANYLIRSSGPLRDLDLARSQRKLIFRAHMRMLSRIEARAFAGVVDKRKDYASPNQVFDTAWSYLLQRLNRTSQDEGASFMIVHDEGEDDAIRKWARKVRRHLTAGSAINPGQTLVTKAERLIDDPIPRRSDDAFLIQMADLVAYAGFRDVVPPSRAVESVCPQQMWSEIGDATHVAVNKYKRRASPGVVVAGLPKRRAPE